MPGTEKVLANLISQTFITKNDRCFGRDRKSLNQIRNRSILLSRGKSLARARRQAYQIGHPYSLNKGVLILITSTQIAGDSVSSEPAPHKQTVPALPVMASLN